MSASTSRPIPTRAHPERGDRQDHRAAGKPAFMMHTGDITHLAKPQQFDDAAQLIGAARLDVHYAPGEHDIWIADARRLSGAVRQGRDGRRLVFLRPRRRAFRLAGQRGRPEEERLGSLGADQIAWLDDDFAASRLRRRSWCSRISRSGRSRPMGLGDRERRTGAAAARALRLGHRAERAYPSGDAEGRRRGDLPHRALHRLSAACPGNRARRRPELVPAGNCANISASPRSPTSPKKAPLAITDRRSPSEDVTMRSLSLALSLGPARRRRRPRRRPRRAALRGPPGLPFARQERRRPAPPRRLRTQGRPLPDFAYSDALKDAGLRLERGTSTNG